MLSESGEHKDKMEVDSEPVGTDIAARKKAAEMGMRVEEEEEEESGLRGRRGSVRAHYWSYLFDNFHRAVDQIYWTCEMDESELECEVRVHACKIHSF